jgi:enoyl-CoA hydratase/carnithine racemase
MLRVTREGVCEVWTVDRPHAANAIDRATVDALAHALSELERSLADGTGPRGLVVASAPRAPGLRPVFLSGADLGELETLAAAEEARAFSARMTALLRQLEALPLLVVAAIAGDVYGGGCELITACDLRVAERGLQLAFRQARMGLSTGWGGTTRLVHLVGMGAAKRLMLTGLPCEADEALRIGLVDELVDVGRALERAKAIVAATAQGGREAVARLKRGIHEAVRLDRDASYAGELDRFVEAWSSEEHRTALGARKRG